MTEKNKNIPLAQTSGLPIDGLAMAVVQKLLAEPTYQRRQRFDAGSSLLLDAALSNAELRHDAIRKEMAELQISEHDQVDHCIPDVARKLGVFWLDDTLSFARVSGASARLFGYCKFLSESWNGISRPRDNLSILLATVDREDHIIGPAVLAHQLRRRGHSVTLMSNSNPDQLSRRLESEPFDCIMMSLSTLVGVTGVAKAVKCIRSRVSRAVPTMLGGAALEHLDDLQALTGADLVTNDIDTALASLTKRRAVIKAAE